MSVIIRLQNLPWSANALDIRQYFRGLSIPEGGVHIVGGEQGDAFIAFSTDEDARQAMMVDGGKIKEVKIKLLLSSRTQMQKVIENARQQSMTLQNFMQMPAPPITPSSLPVHALSSLIGSLPVVTTTAAIPAATAPAIPSAGSMVPDSMVPTTTVASGPVMNSMERRDDKKDADSGAGKVSAGKERKERSRSREGDRRDRRDRDRDRHRDRDRDRRSRRDRSRSRDRERSSRRSRRDRSRTRDRSRSRERDRDTRRSSSVRDVKRDSPEEDKDKDNGDVVVVAQYQAKDIIPVPAKLEPMKQMIKKPPAAAAVPAATAPAKTPAATQPGMWDMAHGGALQNSFKPMMGSGSMGVGSVGSMNTMNSMASRPMQVGLDLRSGSGYPGDLTRGSLQSGSLNLSASDSMQSPFLRGENFGSGRELGGGQSASVRGRESWPPTRQPSELSRFPRDRMAGNFPMKQEPLRGNGAAANYDVPDEYERGEYEQGMGRGSFRGNYRGGSMDYRRGMYPPRDNRMGPANLPGPNMMDRMGQNDIDRRSGMSGYGMQDRRSQFRMDRGDTEFHRNNDRFDPYDRSYMNDRHFQTRPNNFGNERFPRERYPQGDRSFDPRAQNDMRSQDPRSQNAGTCIEVRHMPPEAAYGDVRRFFQGHFIAQNGLKLINDNHGNRVGIAYVKFGRIEDKEIALTYTGKTIRGSIVEVLHLEDEIFDKAIDSYRPSQDSDMEMDISEVSESKPEMLNDQYVCLSVHDLPPYVKEQDIFKLFHGYTVVEVVMSVTKGVKKEYEAYVKFSRHEDAKKALHSSNKHMIGHKVLVVRPCSVEQLQEARKQHNGFEDDKTESSQDEILEKGASNEPLVKPQDPRSRNSVLDDVEMGPQETHTKVPLLTNSDCVLLKGLPIQANDRDILDFFSDVGLVPLRIHIMLDKFGKATGDAFCEFTNTEEASRALTKNTTPLGKQEVSVQSIPRAEMSEALGIPSSQVEPLVVQAARPPLMAPGRNFARTGLLGSSPNSLGGRMHLMGRIPIGQSQSQDAPVEGFGKPGCVLAVENIPFKAVIDEILEFLGDFEVSRENVIRRFNEKGMPTGEARVAFSSPSEAQRALRELRSCRIRGRPIFMKPL